MPACFLTQREFPFSWFTEFKIGLSEAGESGGVSRFEIAKPKVGLGTWYGAMEQWLGEMKDDIRTKMFTDYMLTQMPLYKQEVERTLEARELVEKLPRTTIHTDIQISNFKYTDDEVSGLFDFDWATEGARVYDVAYAAKSFCGSWQWETMGDVSLDKMETFLRTYNEEMKRLACPLGTLTGAEIDVLPAMLQAGFLRCTYDFVDEFYHDRSLNVFQYYLYGLRFSRSVQFMARHRDELVRIARSL